MTVRGAVVPHAPLLARESAGQAAPAVGRLRAALRALSFRDASTVVVVSPHGPSTGVYRTGDASLRRFGLEGPAFEAEIDAGRAESLAQAWGHPLLDAKLDHGIVVPLELTGFRGPVVAATIGEYEDPAVAVGQGRSLARALDALSGDTLLLASANTSASLTARAPLGLRPGSAALDERLIALLRQGGGDAAGLLEELAREGASCGAGPLAAFVELFAGRTRVEAYEAPFGVGYLVAVA